LQLPVEGLINFLFLDLIKFLFLVLRILFCVGVFWCLVTGTLQPYEDVIAQIPTVEICSFYRDHNKGNKSDFVIKISLKTAR